MNQETYPIGSKIRFQFPARSSDQTSLRAKPQKGAELLLRRATDHNLPPVTLWWYDGGKPDGPNGGHDGSNKPPQQLTKDIEAMLGEMPGSGCLLVGDQGTIFSPDDYGEQFFIRLSSENKFTHFKKHPAVAKIPQTISRNQFSGDNDLRQHLEWIAAIKAGKPEMCYSRFDIGAQLTEIMLLGCVALRVGKKIEWDGPNMRAINCPEAAQFIKRDNRAGWVLS